jgi:hypothetical protein
LLAKTPRDMRAAALRGSAAAMGSEFWSQGSPYQAELADQLSFDPNSIVHTLRWPNARVEIFSFQEVRHGNRGRMYYHAWTGYRFAERVFPQFDLKPAGVVPFIRRGWWRKISLPGQVDFASRYVLTGEDSSSIELFFTPDRCRAILSQPWPGAVTIKAGGHWLFAHHEQLFNATSESDSESSVSEEILEISTLITEILPLAEALTDSSLVEQTQRYVGLPQDPSAKKRRPWREGLLFLALAAAIAGSILFAIFFLGPWWEHFDKIILKTETQRYLFAILFVTTLGVIGEWLIRFYQRTKQRAATRLEARFSAAANGL